ncbi:three-Cys-motif partner protein TcmP [Micromonospora craniellae]|uniref:Three-Cys-motif partner protein TcmP n=1 Tax=Micromonospora craniellae TaxID=2294034 RepID=A0A372FZH6_9ACTN|nr:three-Cys-motif partner protein TcmP [Micromonospora craniellae]QOC91491.1 three-Cys-motif partner protein TcmP [Micromonospora craniellae]RFS46185.1 three-Cys-motif partner protein TcmP [Micromonospora craniellae]
MPVDGPVPWPCAEHTGAKHDIYRRYLERWFPILLAGYPSVTYAEGFAGPGIYSGGEAGSPVIAIRALVQEVSANKGITRFVFIDDDERCVKMLRETLQEAFPVRPRSESAMPVMMGKGTCADDLGVALDQMGAWGQPIFANLDSWGNAPVPFKLLQRLAGNVSTEVIVTLLPQHFVRFVSNMGEAGDDVFGGDPHWRDVVNLPPAAKSRHILTCYRQALEKAGFPYLLDFELIPRNGQPLYLVFGTGHPLGVQKMKDSLWEVDRAQGVGFRDPRDEQAETLFAMDEPLLGPLTRLLQQRLRDSGPVRVEDLRRFALLETVYRPEHVIKALKPLVDNGSVKIADGGRLQRSSFVSL